MNRYFCSSGERVSQAQINARYSAAIRHKHYEGSQFCICEACLKRRAVHNDHTIAKARCKVIHKTELIWDPRNFVNSCEICHAQWENFKSGHWIGHANYEERLWFMKQHDPEGYNIRIELTEFSLRTQE